MAFRVIPMAYLHPSHMMVVPVEHARKAAFVLWRRGGYPRLSLLACAVLRLGRIEWLRPTYHTKKHIFPVGYSAVRAVEISATRGNFVQCLCEIAASSDSFAPVFRYTMYLAAAPVHFVVLLCGILLALVQLVL